MGGTNAWWVRGQQRTTPTDGARPVEECGEQPLEPRRKCATRERLQEEKGRNGSKGKQREQKAAPCTSSSTFPLQPLQQPQQPQQLQRQCVYNDARDVRRNVGLHGRRQRVRRSDAGATSRPAQQCVEWPEAPEKSGLRRVTTCECGGLDRDESGDAGEEPGSSVTRVGRHSFVSGFGDSRCFHDKAYRMQHHLSHEEGTDVLDVR